MNAARTAALTTDTTFAFDGTACTIKPARVHGDTREGLLVTVTEGDVSLALETRDGGDLVQNAAHNADMDSRLSAWAKQRMVFVFGLAARRLIAA